MPAALDFAGQYAMFCAAAHQPGSCSERTDLGTPDGLGNAPPLWLVGRCCGGGRSPERSCGQGGEPGEAGDDAGALAQSAEADEPGRLAEARTGQGHGRQHGHGGASTVKTEAVLAGPPGPPGTGERGRGQADEHRDSRQIVCGAGTAGLGERIGCSGRVATDRVSGEDGRADKPRACGADQRRCSPAAGCPITSASQACGPGHDQRPGHREVSSLDPAARSERERTDWVAQRPVTIPDSTLKQERRDKNRACGHTTAQQPAGPCLRRTGDAGRAHQRSVAGQPLPPAGCSVPESVNER